MPKSLWKPCQAQIADYPAIQIGRLGSKEYETALAGYEGEVWEDGQTYKAWLSSVAVARLKRAGKWENLRKLRRGEETFLRFSAEKLPEVLKAIKYTSRRPNQAAQANSR